MRQYLDAVRHILEHGTRKPNRTGVDTLSTFGVHYNIDLQEGFPLLTTKKIKWEHIVIEMLWFLSGRTDIGILKKHNFKFWDAWADPQTGEVPSAYGNFWRKFPVHSDEGPYSGGVYGDFNDQIAWLVNTLKRDPSSRRMVVSAWAPGNAQTSALPPCHCMFAVNVQMVNNPYAGEPEIIQEGSGTYLSRNRIVQLADLDKRLCLHLTQRSCDIALGVPYNIASYALLMHLLSRFSGIPVGTFSHLLVDAHAYTSKPDGSKAEHDHVPGLREQLTREPRRLPTLRISDKIQSLADVEALIDCETEVVMKHFELVGYDPHPAIPFKVAV